MARAEAVEQLVVTNEQQREFYESHGDRLNAGANLAGKLWGRLRRRMARYRRHLGIKSYIRELHRRWLGDLHESHVLDLGCYDGNSMSLYLAAHSKDYLGIDLSESAIDRLKEKLQARGHSNANARAIDYLSPQFRHEPFDVIYANGVLHHFEDFPVFLDVLCSRLNPGGRVVSYDPLQTSWLSRAARAMYRPFQADAAWEWPFTRQTLALIETRFHIEAVQGTLGFAKWTFPLALLPFGHRPAVRLGGWLHQRDLRRANRLGRGLWRCLHVALHLRRRD